MYWLLLRGMGELHLCWSLHLTIFIFSVLCHGSHLVFLASFLRFLAMLVFKCHGLLSSAVCQPSSGTKNPATKPLPAWDMDTHHSLSTLDLDSRKMSCLVQLYTVNEAIQRKLTTQALVVKYLLKKRLKSKSKVLVFEDQLSAHFNVHLSPIATTSQRIWL